MPLGALDKGKGKAIPEPTSSASSSSGSGSESSSSEDTESESDSEDEITPEYLESLLQKARQNVASTSRKSNEEEVIKLGGGSKEGYVLPVLFTGCS